MELVLCPPAVGVRAGGTARSLHPCPLGAGKAGGDLITFEDKLGIEVGTFIHTSVHFFFGVSLFVKFFNTKITVTDTEWAAEVVLVTAFFFGDIIHILYSFSVESVI